MGIASAGTDRLTDWGATDRCLDACCFVYKLRSLQLCIVLKRYSLEPQRWKAGICYCHSTSPPVSPHKHFTSPIARVPEAKFEMFLACEVALNSPHPYLRISVPPYILLQKQSNYCSGPQIMVMTKIDLSKNATAILPMFQLRQDGYIWRR